MSIETFGADSTAEQVTEGLDLSGKRYLVTKENGLLASVDDVSLARRSHYIPPRIQNKEDGRRTWIDVSILGGWLVAYEYNKPVYATMVSPGRGSRRMIGAAMAHRIGMAMSPPPVGRWALKWP